jgi:hypothetical protein
MNFIDGDLILTKNLKKRGNSELLMNDTKGAFI